MTENKYLAVHHGKYDMEETVVANETEGKSLVDNLNSRGEKAILVECTVIYTGRDWLILS